MSRFHCWASFAPVSVIAPTTTSVELTFWPHLVVLCWGECFLLRLHGVHGHSHMCQLCHSLGVRAGKYCIGLCHYFQLVSVCSHSLHNCLYFFNHLMMIFWRGWRCTLVVLHCRGVPSLSCGFCRFFCSLCARCKNDLYFSHVLRLVDCRLHSLMSSLKITVCTSRVIPFDIIIASEIVWPPDPANSLPFSNCFISWYRGSAGSYGPIIFNAFSPRSISSIALYLENRCYSMVCANTCTKPVSWSNSGDRKTSSTSVTICFFKALYTAVYFWNSAWFCLIFSVPSACS